MADRNEPVGARLRRLFSNQEAQEYGASVGGGFENLSEPMRRQGSGPGTRSMREVMRGQTPSATGEATPREAMRSVSRGRSMVEPEGTLEAADVSRMRQAPQMRISEPEGTDEAAAALASRAAIRRAAANRPTTRMRPRPAGGSEMSADELNAMSLVRGVGADNAPDTAAAANIRRRLAEMEPGMKKGGRVKKMAKGGVVKVSASRRGDGCATKGKTKGRMV